MTHGWQGKEGNSDKREGGSQQTPVPGDGEFVSVAYGGQGDLERWRAQQSIIQLLPVK